MGEVTSYPPGAPAWVDLSTSDPKGAREFYRAMFGWELAIKPDETDDYTMCLVGGGQLVMGPVDAGTAGRVAVASDPSGALFGLWQAGEHIGATRVDEPGTVTWNERVTDDLGRAQTFLSAVCGHSWAAEDTGEGGPAYATFAVDGRPVGGAMQRQSADLAPHWLTYFAVVDAQAAATAAERHGSTVRMAPTPTRYGMYALLTDPKGGVFAVMASDPQP